MQNVSVYMYLHVRIRMGRYIGRYTYLGSLNFRVRQWKIFFPPLGRWNSRDQKLVLSVPLRQVYEDCRSIDL